MPSFSGLEKLTSPGLLFDADAIERNLERMLEFVDGNAALLRPHIKTHKCAGILKRQLELGITSVKCATLAEADLSAQVGVPDVLISYPLIGPNVERLAALVESFSGTSFSTVVDSKEGIATLADASFATPLKVFLDLDIGMHRTGISPGDEALALIRSIQSHASLRFAGVHAYDGHIHAADLVVRRTEFDASINLLDQFLGRLDLERIEVPLIVSGGSPTFPFHAARALSSSRPWQCSPGTPVLWDAGYGGNYPDLPFEPAAFLLTRVISLPGKNTACLDLGHKAVSAENPLSNRVRFPNLEELSFLSQSEEHLVVETAQEAPLSIGDAILAIPYHVCPTVALYDEAHIVRDDAATGEVWSIQARRRNLSA